MDFASTFSRVRGFEETLNRLVREVGDIKRCQERQLAAQEKRFERQKRQWAAQEKRFTKMMEGFACIEKAFKIACSSNRALSEQIDEMHGNVTDLDLTAFPSVS